VAAKQDALDYLELLTHLDEILYDVCGNQPAVHAVEEADDMVRTLMLPYVRCLLARLAKR
jgi:hypothetical protein